MRTPADAETPRFARSGGLVLNAGREDDTPGMGQCSGMSPEREPQPRTRLRRKMVAALRGSAGQRRAVQEARVVFAVVCKLSRSCAPTLPFRVTG